MKKFFSKLMKDTRGVVMMEYIVLGLFAVAVTVAAVHVLGQTYNNGLLAMSKATIGDTQGTVAVIQLASQSIYDRQQEADDYATDLINAAQTASKGLDIYDYEVY